MLDLNQENMEDDGPRAPAQTAAASIRLMILALLVAAVVAGGDRRAAEPVDPRADPRGDRRGARRWRGASSTRSCRPASRDELGELADAFNEMARTIREFRQAGTARLLRAQKTAQATIDSFPDPVVVVDPAGVGRAGQPGGPAPPGRGAGGERLGPLGSAPAALKPPGQRRARRPRRLPADSASSRPLCLRDDGQERFFLPRVLAIRGDDDELLGAAVVLADVTKFRLVDQLKSDMVSTVSHELKTPLTSVQMAIHLLLEEVVGPLTPKQVELLLAARQDSDRLLAMVNDLLDLTRIEQGRVRLDLRAGRRRPTWSTRRSTGSRPGPAMPGIDLEADVADGPADGAWSIASGSSMSSTT